MSNLQKFNSTLEDFDKEVGKLKEVSAAYHKLDSLTATYDSIVKQFESNSNTLAKISELQKAQQEKLSKSLSDIENANKLHKSEISKLVEEKTDQIRKENKEFYKDLESTIKIKLEENKSQIKQIIENERSQIKEIFEIEFAKNTRELRQVIEAETNKQTQIILDNQKVIKLSVWIIGSVSIILSAIAVFKLVLHKF